MTPIIPMLFYFFFLGLVPRVRSQQVLPTPTFTKAPDEGLHVEQPTTIQVDTTTITTGPIVITASPTSFYNPYTDINAGEILYASIEAQVITAEEYQLRKNRETSVIDPVGFRALLYSAAGFTGLALLWVIATRFKKFRLLMGSHEDKEVDELREDWEKHEQDVLSGKGDANFEEGLPCYYSNTVGLTRRPSPYQCTCDLGDSSRRSVHWEKPLTYPAPYPVHPPYTLYR